MYKTQTFQLHIDEKASILYESLADDTKNNWERLKAAMETFFAPTQLPAVQAFQILKELKMSANESVQEFFHKFIRYTKDLDLTEIHKIAVFTSRLPKYIKDYLVIQNPDSLEEAFRLAKVKELLKKIVIWNI